jgi:hypothetical protein
MKTLKTFGGRSSFEYAGNVDEGTTIRYSSKNLEAFVSSQDYSKLISHFNGMRVPCGTSIHTPKIGSLGEWLQENVNRKAHATYVGAILVEEGIAEKDGAWIKFHYFK